jgi:hypothetical protein
MITERRGWLPLATRANNQINNWFDRRPLDAGEQARSAAFLRQFGVTPEHTRGGPTCAYNCHGLTFASRRTGVSYPEVVRRILDEDEYVKVDKDEVKPGDVVVYVAENGDVEHSGIVIEVPAPRANPPRLGIRIISKWGEGHEVIHFIGHDPYESTNLEFYRIRPSFFE